MTSLIDELKIAVHGVWQRRWLALAVAWALCLAGWLLVSLMPRSFESRARMQVEINDIVPDATGPSLDTQRQFDQLRQSITSARNLEIVAETAGLVDRAADDRSRAAAAAMLQQNTKVSASLDNIIALSVELSGGGRSDSENAGLATKVLDAMIATFRDQQMRGGVADAEQNIRFLDSQINEIGRKVMAAETARSAFETRNLGLLPGVGGSPSSRLDAARSELGQVESQLVGAQASLAAIRGQLGATPPSIMVPGLGATGIGVARQQLASAEAELSGMRARGLTAAHPDVIALLSQIQALRAQAAREPGASAGGNAPNPAYASLQSVFAERQAQVVSLTSRRAQLAAQIGSITASRTQEPAVAAEYERLNRDYTVLKDQNDRLVTRREQIRLRGAAQSGADAVRIEILDRPTTPTGPSKPNKPLLVVGVLLLGLAGGIAAAFAMSQMQTTYATANRLSQASGLPVIGSVTEIMTPELIALRQTWLRRFVGATGALGLLCAVLLAADFLQRSTVG